MSATRFERLKSGLIVPKGRARRVTPPSGPVIITRRNLLASGAAALLFSTPAEASGLSLIAHAPIIAAGSAGGTSAPINPTGSTCVFIADASNRFVNPTSSDSLGNSWGSNIGGNANSTFQVGMGFVLSPTTGAGQTFSNTGGGANSQAVAFGFNLVTAFQNANGTAFDTAGTTTVTTPSITPTQPFNLAISICAVRDSSFATPDSGFIVIDNVVSTVNAMGIAVAYKAQNTATAVSPTWTFGSVETLGAVARTAVFSLSADPFGSPRGTLFHSFPP